MAGKLYIVGIGPGKTDYITKKALRAIKDSDVIIGYKTYLEFIEEHTNNKEVIGSGMKGEVDRAKKAVEKAEEKTVSIISGGDPNIYGISGITMEIAKNRDYKGEIEIIPGVTAFAAAGSLLKNPYNNGVCCISMSDLLTPWKDITQRARTAAKHDITTVFYNPRSTKRKENLRKTLRIFSENRPKTQEAVIAKNIARPNQELQKTTLEKIQKDSLYSQIGMRSLVIIGSSNSQLQIQNKEHPQIVGIGPGNPEHLTQKAIKQIENSRKIYGPKTYLSQIKPLLNNHKTHSHSNLEYQERIKTRIQQADRDTAILSGGDPSIYGHKQKQGTKKVTPGITAYQALASKAGAPIINDFIIKSASQQDWLETTKDAIKTDFAVGIYNTSPSEIKKIKQLTPEKRPIAIGRNITRKNQQLKITTPSQLKTNQLTPKKNYTTLIPNSNSIYWKERNFIITRRGYKNKYDY
ncbi:precorrin-3B C(17)-methyltransferase [Methanonatronarchaeum sp. AMET6-2]|uniref:precorrin-3B C(17)-methyltransferase n=1 Tax=Methanonatronarchaeum sp. AMET6-2 TaxID=2933293 RepID=UPI0012283410|nr:precorrin-3B C(17)-methyltransferase [Methanonatronarchaeum sp. AMET6-2]RZN63418.1 MAG: precorrin-3B C(17)-methyltransferase [Methanonatronarchaeia archaeon]UOY10085.1 precorrin-3B C(17)-methyltransferase [Methanonatronarchaeum sp. AMET6-2]